MEPSARLVQPGEMWRHRAVGMAVMGSLGCPHSPLLPFPTLSSSSCRKRGLSRVSSAVEPQGWEAASQPGGPPARTSLRHLPRPLLLPSRSAPHQTSACSRTAASSQKGKKGRHRANFSIQLDASVRVLLGSMGSILKFLSSSVSSSTAALIPPSCPCMAGIWVGGLQGSDLVLQVWSAWLCAEDAAGTRGVSTISPLQTLPRAGQRAAIALIITYALINKGWF